MTKEMVAVICRCSKTKKLFGMRFDKAKGNVWECAWAFPMKEGAEKREQGFSSSVSGRFEISSEYPGCPHCENTTFFMCGKCKKLACWDGKNSHVICPHCGFEGDLDSPITEIHGDQNI